MSIHADDIQLDDAQRQRLARLSEQAGKPWPVVFDEALSVYQRQTPTKPDASSTESFFDAATRLGLIGCVDGPADLSTNPAYMEGFGRDDG